MSTRTGRSSEVEFAGAQAALRIPWRLLCRRSIKRHLFTDGNCGRGRVAAQCAINTGSVIDFSTVREAPPSTSSRARLWP